MPTPSDRPARLRGALALVVGSILFVAASVAAAQNKPDDVIVTRGGVSVTLLDIDDFVAGVPKEHRQRFIDSPQRIRDMLNNMLLTKQLAALARQAHVDQRPEIASQLHPAAGKSDLPDAEVLSRAYLADFLAGIKVPDLAPLVAEQYATHKDLYKLPASADVRHVLIATELHSDDEAKAIAEKVRAEALANPQGFEALVEKYSEDSSRKENQGLMKDATSERFVEEFRNAAAALQTVGEVSPVVKTSYGYHVLILVAKHPEHQQTLDEVREALTAQMRDVYIANQKRELVNQLTNEKIDINSAVLDTLRDRYDENGDIRVVTTPAAPAGGRQPAIPAGG